MGLLIFLRFARTADGQFGRAEPVPCHAVTGKQEEQAHARQDHRSWRHALSPPYPESPVFGPFSGDAGSHPALKDCKHSFRNRGKGNYSCGKLSPSLESGQTVASITRFRDGCSHICAAGI
ncbi:hypothetical protein RGUI_3935 [Rhodovulum sp. P5]|nr:hypothetical protein RGUI_3935 [Rhodovulum sp. P5]